MKRIIAFCLLSLVVGALAMAEEGLSAPPPQDPRDARVFVKNPYFLSSIDVRVDGKKIATLRGNTYAVIDLSPGDHVVNMYLPSDLVQQREIGDIGCALGPGESLRLVRASYNSRYYMVVISPEAWEGNKALGSAKVTYLDLTEGGNE